MSTMNGPANWLSQGEKYALIGLTAKIERFIPFGEIRPGLWAWTDHELEVPGHWREWLGSIRADEIRNCSFVLLSKMPTKTPRVLDGENRLLQTRVWRFYLSLLLSSTFTPAHAPIVLTGAHLGTEIDVRQESTLDTPSLNLFRYYPAILTSEVESAARLAECYERLVTTQPAGGAWRINRALSVYVASRTSQELLDRVHQYCRCIDGLILSEPGRGASQFKSRTELFIGPRHHDLMGELCAIRSDVEHLHEHKYVETFDRTLRLDLVQKEAIVEHIARKALAHIIGNPSLWPHFGNIAALAQFWRLHPADRQALWAGPIIDPSDALQGYDATYIKDGELGGP